MPADRLLAPLTAGAVSLANRIVMAPLTRERAHYPDDVPTELMREYYCQRADAGLIISEGTQISPSGKGYADTPGIYSAEQVAGWRRITDAVHQLGGKMAAQLWHVGRISHTSLQQGNLAPVAPSALIAASRTTVRRADGTLDRIPCSMPRALRTDEIPALLDDYRRATVNAREAGFDLVEIHAAHGYLLHQFLSPHSNQRTDAYGGSLENRARLVLEVVDAVAGSWQADRVGIRLSPLGIFNGLDDTGSEDMALYLAEQLSCRGMAYLHLSEPDWAGGPALTDDFRQQLRRHYTGPLIAAGGYDTAKAERLLAAGLIDAVAFGRAFIANPDLVTRLSQGLPLNAVQQATVYGGGAAGYTDYPRWSGAALAD